MPNFNQVTIIGHLTRAPELRATSGGTQVCEVGIAYNDYKKNAHFFDCVAFNKTAELIAGTFEKGEAVGFIGELSQDRWDDKTTGQKRSKVKIIVNKVIFLGGGKGKSDDDTDYAVTLPSAGVAGDDEPAF